MFINLDLWSSSKQKAIPPNKESTNLNNKLRLIHQQIDKAFLILQIQPNDFDRDDIYRKYKGRILKQKLKFC